MSAPARRLLIVDAVNLVVRYVRGLDLAPEEAAARACVKVERVAADLGAAGLVLAFDCEGPTFRHELTAHLDEDRRYKAGRDFDTRPAAEAMLAAAEANGWRCLHVPGFEGDDLLGGLAARARRANLAAYVLSGDKDAGVTTRGEPGEPGSVAWLRTMDGGVVETWSAARVAAKYGLAFSSQLTDYKALVGEPGDNVAGVPGIGPKKAAALIALHVDIAAILKEAKRGTPGLVAKVAEHAEAALLARQLVALREDVPLPPLTLAGCRWRSGAAAV